VLIHQKFPAGRRRLMLKYALGSAWNGQFLRTWIDWRHQTLLVLGQVNPAKNNGWFRFAFYWLLLCLHCSSIEWIFDFWSFQWQSDFRKSLIFEKNATVGDQVFVLDRSLLTAWGLGFRFLDCPRTWISGTRVVLEKRAYIFPELEFPIYEFGVFRSVLKNRELGTLAVRNGLK
jgi:hypothetical protein